MAIYCSSTRLRSLAIDFSSEMLVRLASYSSPLLQAYYMGDTKAAKTIIQRAKQKGSLEFIDQGSDRGLPALLEAAMMNDTSFLDLLLGEGANINEQWRGEGPPLKLACEMGHLEAVKTLVESGADTTWINSTELSDNASTPLDTIRRWLSGLANT